MNRLAVAVAVVSFAIMSQPSAAQAQQQPSTVADILNGGGKKLAKDELQRLYAGTTISGHEAGKSAVTFQNQYLPDGSVSGNGWRNGVSFGNITGTWHMNDVGQVCNDLNGNFHNCTYYFTISGKYYAAQTDAPLSPVYERQITR